MSMDITRNLSAEWYHKIPAMKIEGVLDTSSVSACYFHLLFVLTRIPGKKYFLNADTLKQRRLHRLDGNADRESCCTRKT